MCIRDRHLSVTVARKEKQEKRRLETQKIGFARDSVRVVGCIVQETTEFVAGLIRTFSMACNIHNV